MELAAAVIAEARRRLIGESGPRLRRCLELCPREDLWWRPHPTMASVGNLTLHLCGNIQQWVIAGLGAVKDRRDRTAEFEATEVCDGEALRARWDAVMTQADAVNADLEPAELLRPRPVQAFEETGLAILVHVVEHASYHVGQITWIVKARTGADTGYYAGLDLGRHDG